MSSIIEVAKAAGVSTATVSRVLNELPGVSGDTVSRVQAAVDALKYDPHRTRRGPKAGSKRRAGRRLRSGNIAAITIGQTRDWLQLPVMASAVAGMSAAAAEFGLRLILVEASSNGSVNPMIERRQIDGGVVFMSGYVSPQEYQHVFDQLRQYVPIVWAMGMEITATGVDHVSTDNIRIGYLANQYLQSRGCRDVAFLTVDPVWPFMRLRAQSFLNAAHDAGQTGTAYLVVEHGYDVKRYGESVVVAESLEQLVAQFAAANPRPKGLFCGNDRTTAVVYPLLIRHGIQPGRDVTIVSCDNEEIRLASLDPRPATIDISAEQIGFRAVIRLQARLERPDEMPLSIHVAPRLVVPGVTEEK